MTYDFPLGTSAAAMAAVVVSAAVHALTGMDSITFTAESATEAEVAVKLAAAQLWAVVETRVLPEGGAQIIVSRIVD